MESKHTPGEWRASGPRVIDSRDIELAEVHQTPSRPSAEEAAANARLIAAAPELLEALREVVAGLEQMAIGPDDLDRARAAIAKAEGRS